MRARRRSAAGVLAAVAVVAAMVASGGPMVGAAPGGNPESSSVRDSAVASAAVARVAFEPNRGQFDPAVLFRGTGGGVDVFITSTGATYVVPDAKRVDRAVAIQMTLRGAHPATRATAVGAQPRQERRNYFFGSDPNAWHADVPTFGRVDVSGVYPGVDLTYYTDARGDLEYDFVVAPGADPELVQLDFAGAKSVKVNKRGDLELRTDVGTLVHARPVVYQLAADGTREAVTGRYDASGATVGFDLGTYDATRPLVIDPTVTLGNRAVSTYLGGATSDVGAEVAVDAAGNIYVVGGTLSSDFPATAGAFDPTANGTQDAFVTKLDAAGTDVIYSTFVGSSASDSANALAVDLVGNVHIVGATSGSSFPTTAGAFDTTHNASNDAFLSKLGPTGSTLLYSTYLGGSASEIAHDVELDASGFAYVVGETGGGAIPFPTTPGAFQTSPGGSDDVFVSKFELAGAGSTDLRYSTFIGGESVDEGQSIAIDASGNAYVTGRTFVDTIDPIVNYPTNHFDLTHNGGNDAFVTKLNATGSALTYSTFLGGSDDDQASGIDVDASGAAYVVGFTFDGAIDFPTTSGADTSHNGFYDAFVTKFAPNATFMAYSTFLGGSLNDNADAVFVDSESVANVVGETVSSTFPVTADAANPSPIGGQDGFFVQLAPAGSLRHSTYLGGTGSDNAQGVTADPFGNAYVVGATTSTDVPTSLEAYRPRNNGSNDVFVMKFGDHSIGGRILGADGTPVAGRQVSLSGPVGGFTTTDAGGWYGFLNTAAGGTFTVAPTNSGDVNPTSHSFPSLQSNVRGNFVVSGFFSGTPGQSNGCTPGGGC